MDESNKANHGARVAFLAHRLGEALGLREASSLYYAGLLHDVGSVGVAIDALHGVHVSADGRQHAERGARLLRPIASLRPLEDVIRDHHERTDGRGFPNGKRAGQISLGSSVIRMSDELELALRGAPPAERRARVRAVLIRERGAGVPARVAEAAGDLLGAGGDLLDVLYDDASLHDIIASFCPPPPVQCPPRAELLLQLLWVLARVVDAKHSYTMGHSTRVAYFGLRIAEAFGGDVDAWDVAWAGLLHDVGRLALPRRLLDKPGTLDPDERRAIQGHAPASRRVIATIRDLAHLAIPAASHHERYDGTGYPSGLAGEAIPLVGRILAYADTYDALTSERAHRAAAPHAETLSRLRSCVGSALDPHLAEAAFDALQRYGGADRRGARDTPFADFFASDDADFAPFDVEVGTSASVRAALPSAGQLLAAEASTPSESRGAASAQGRPPEGERGAAASARLPRRAHRDDLARSARPAGSDREPGRAPARSPPADEGGGGRRVPGADPRDRREAERARRGPPRPRQGRVRAARPAPVPGADRHAPRAVHRARRGRDQAPDRARAPPRRRSARGEPRSSAGGADRLQPRGERGEVLPRRRLRRGERPPGGGGDRVEIRVEDRGPGIPEEALEAIFDRHYQVQRRGISIARGTGMGLGLHIVKTLVAAHAGSVRAENRGGGGCRFVVDLPTGRGTAAFERPVVVVVGRGSKPVEALLQMLEELGLHALRLDVGAGLHGVCALTSPELVLCEEAVFDGSVREFAQSLAGEDGLPVLVRLITGELEDPNGNLVLTMPVLESEVRELLREAALRRAARGGRR